MNLNDKLTIERALGVIEGVSVGVDEKTAIFLINAVETIAEVIDKERSDA